MEPTNVEKVRALPWSIGGNAGIAVFNQFTYFGSVYVLFLSELGFNSSQIGFLLSLLGFLGALAVITSPIIVRLGYKRAFIRFCTARQAVTGLLLLAPWLLARFGLGLVFAYTAVVMVIFVLLRTVAETALMSWQQEFVPSAIQGKYFATGNMFVSLASLIAVAAASYIVERTAGLTGFVYLFGMGMVIGLVSTWCFTHVPGGAQPTALSSTANLSGVRAALRDRDFTRFLVGVAMIVLGTVPLAAFLPLFLRDKVGLSAAQVVFLQSGHLLPGLLASYLWGWTADRYGSKPIMLWGVYFIALLPVLWFVMPRETGFSFAVALSITLLQGLAHSAWAVGLTRLFYVSVVPPEKKSNYIAMYFAMVSLTSGLSALAGGWLLQLIRGLDARVGGFMVDSYSVLFLVCILLPVLAVWFFATVRADSPLTTRQVAGLFLRGNVLMAMESLIRFYVAKDERSTVATTARLGMAHSPLTVNELLEALEDPRFNVRFEALISIARRGPDDQLLQALARVLHGRDPAVSVMAAWAMGRIGDRRAIEPLRQGLNSRYRSVQGHCARALATLDDRASAGLLLERLERENDQGLQIAYVSALGRLREKAAVGRLLELLRASDDEITQKELALALARILGDEHYFIQLYRQSGEEPGAALSRAVSSLGGRVMKTSARSQVLRERLNAAAATLAREDLSGGVALFSQAIRLVPDSKMDDISRSVLQACAGEMEALGASRIEYLMLSLHALNCCEPFSGANA